MSLHTDDVPTQFFDEETLRESYREMMEGQRRHEEMQQRRLRPVDDRTDGTQEWTQCIWVCESSWAKRQCGRDALVDLYCLPLCWQHQDAVVSHVLSLVERGRTRFAQFEDLAEALLTAEGLLGEGDSVPRSRSIKRLADEVVYRRFYEMSQGEYIEPDLERLMEEIIRKRLEEKWGTV